MNDEVLTYIKGNPADPATFDDYAVQEHFLSSGELDLTKAEVDATMQGSVCMSLQAWDDVNAEIAKFCSEVHCNYELTQKLSQLMKRIHAQAQISVVREP